MRIDRVYTKTGDQGQTRLVGGRQIHKDEIRLETYGTVDEFNSTIGLVRVACRKSENAFATSVDEKLTKIQHQLFDLGSELATHPEDIYPQMPLIEDNDIQELETQMDQWTEELPPLTSFILPGGGEISAFLHLARTTCRRTERVVVALSRKEPVRPEVLQYLNRLSDYLFVLVRKISQELKESEELWTK